MELDVSIGKESLAIEIENPFRLDIGSMMQKIETFLSAQGVLSDGMDIEGLISRMVKGIAGCEAGCPADAKSLVSSGYGDFTMEYIEGGILSAKAKIENGKTLHVNMFPDF